MFAAELFAQAAEPHALLNGPTVSFIAFWAAVTLMVVIPSACHYWAQVKKAEIDARLKMQMLERGYSSSEILAVMQNKSGVLPSGVSHGKGGAMTPSKLPPETAHV